MRKVSSFYVVLSLLVILAVGLWLGGGALWAWVLRLHGIHPH
jgi:hypothetical protein